MVAVAVLAAGRGTRMKSSLPKVLHPVGSLSLVERALNSCQAIQPERYLAIVGYAAERIQQALSHRPEIEFVTQAEQLGTGHAVQQLLPYLPDFQGDLIVLNGDVPLLRPETLQTLLTTHQASQSAATLLTAQIANPRGYGRVFCDAENRVQEIIEDRDCTPEQKQNCRINAGVYCFNWAKLATILPDLKAENDQKEYYLTDVFSTLEPVTAVDVEDEQEITGVNDRCQLAAAYQILQTRIKNGWMRAGVTLVDPASITIDDTVQLQPDVTIEPQTHLRGKTVVESGCRLGPGSLIENSRIGAHSTVLYSTITDSEVAANVRIGPYAHLRGHAQIGTACRVGNFVEIKQTKLGDRTNVAHLSYLGNATLGDRVNIGAGTITANYDGVNKHPTQIGNGSKTGSNSVLVAPVTLGNNVTVAAGSVVTEDVADDTLVIARSRQVTKPGWQPPTKSP
ncbi:MAG: bifunctional UDP-N-acetylglucosamine diphosphorylase/glucosamine-1-phosphate N-acetyltransferase GlmU [Spirulinaceae cyanobacterium SM2_1_0]|nr:bifunctional UDP-N-acetylglucosamine diphosphorylase/glucosamine-1-phosphate N-acetyltransferase GlmU [Spirulinaceae cyanobacterium SM2_1_0]